MSILTKLDIENACLQHYCKLEIYGSLGKFFFLHRYLMCAFPAESCVLVS